MNQYVMNYLPGKMDVKERSTAPRELLLSSEIKIKIICYSKSMSSHNVFLLTTSLLSSHTCLCGRMLYLWPGCFCYK